jgi:phosphatidylserine decarboxylase
MGRFLLGSTVILLFPKRTLRFRSDWGPGRAVRMGEAMAAAAAVAAPLDPEAPDALGCHAPGGAR